MAGEIAARVTSGGMGRARRGRTGGAAFVVANGRTAFVVANVRTAFVVANGRTAFVVADGRTAFVVADGMAVFVMAFVTAFVSAGSFLRIGFKDNRSFPIA